MKTEFDMEVSSLPTELYGNLTEQKLEILLCLGNWLGTEHISQKENSPLGDVTFLKLLVVISSLVKEFSVFFWRVHFDWNVQAFKHPRG